MPHKLFFGDLVYINYESGKLAGYLNKPKPSLIFPPTKFDTAYRSCIFQVLGVSPDPLQSIVKTATKFNVAILKNTPVMLYHKETGTLLSVQNNEDETKTLILAEKVTDNAIFRLTQTAQANTEGDGIEYDQPLYIEAIRSSLSLAIGAVETEDLMENTKIKEDGDIDEFFLNLIPPKDPTRFSEKSLSVTLGDLPNVFTLTRFQNIDLFKNTQQTITNGDYVRIRHQNQWLAFYPNTDNNKDVYFEKILDSFQQYNYLHTIFQVLDENSMQGDPIIIGDTKSYILKHYLTGNYLHFYSPGSLKAQKEINRTEEENPYLCFETITNEKIVKERKPLRIKYFNSYGSDTFLKPTEPHPVKNVQFEINTQYFFGFNIPEEYCYKNQKNLIRNLAGLSTEFDIEEYNIVLEKVQPDEIIKILKFQNLAIKLNELRSISLNTKEKSHEEVKKINQSLLELHIKCKEITKLIHLKEQIKEIAPGINTKPCKVEITDRFSQALLREYRVFDLFHCINLLYIEIMPKTLRDDKNLALFDAENFLEYFSQFKELFLASLSENSTNRFYNSQFVRIYIHFMLEKCEGIFSKKEKEIYKHKMRNITLEILKMLLWDEDLDALGQLNFYVDELLSDMTNNQAIRTYYLELLEHISNSKAYNLNNIYRDNFIHQILASQDSCKNIFPLLISKPRPALKFDIYNPQEIPLSELHLYQDIYSYFTKALRTIVSLCTGNSVILYHTIIKLYPLEVILVILDNKEISLDLKILLHTIALFVHESYVKIPFDSLLETFKTYKDIFGEDFKHEKEQIITAIKTCIEESENDYLNQTEIKEEVMKIINQLGKEDYSHHRELLEIFLNSDLSLQLSCHKTLLFYIQSIISTGSFNIDLLEKAEETLIYLKKKFFGLEKVDISKAVDILKALILLSDKKKRYLSLKAIKKILTEKISDKTEILSILNNIKVEVTQKFTPDDLLCLNETKISSLCFEYLNDNQNRENYFQRELDNINLIHSQSNKLSETLKIVLALNQYLRKFTICREKNQNFIIQRNEYIQILEFLENILITIYNPSKHFLSFNIKGLDIPLKSDINDLNAHFLRVLRHEKSLEKDNPFKIIEGAVSLSQQNVFSLLSIHELLLQLLNLSLSLTVQDKEQDTPDEIYLTRLLVLILTIFVYKNENNQNLLINSQEFVRRYYEQIFLNKSCDSLPLFAETLRDNRDLLQMSRKFIFDITCSSLVRTIRPRNLLNGGNYLCAAIMSMDFLYKANLSSTIYDSLSIIEEKFKEIITLEIDSINFLKILKEKQPKNQSEINLPQPYYNIKEMLEASIRIIKMAINDRNADHILKLRNIFRTEQILKGLIHGDFFFYFDLKDLFLKCLSKLNFSNKNLHCAAGSDSLSTIVRIITYLQNEIIEFLLYSDRSDEKEISINISEDFQKLISELKVDENYENLNFAEFKENYKDFREFSKRQIKELIFLEEIPISIIWEHFYIFSNCWKLLAKCFKSYPKTIEIPGLFEVFLRISEQLILLTTPSTVTILRQIKKYFEIIKTSNESEAFTTNIIEIVKLINSSLEYYAKEVENIVNLKKEKFEENLEDNSILMGIEKLVDTSKSQENQLENLCELISSHSSRRSILSQCLVSIYPNPINLKPSSIGFIFRLLNSFLHKICAISQDQYNHQKVEFDLIISEFNDLDAERRLAEGIRIIKNKDNMIELFRLILTYASVSNFKTLQNLNQRLTDLKNQFILNHHYQNTKHLENVHFILAELLRVVKTSLDESIKEPALRFLEYLLRVSKQNSIFNLEDDLILLKRKIDSFFKFEEVIQDKMETSEKTEPVLIKMNNLKQVFQINEEDALLVRQVKNYLLKSVKESEFEKIIIEYFQRKARKNENDLEFIQIDGLMLLDFLISLKILVCFNWRP